MKTLTKILALLIFLTCANVEAANLTADSEKIISQELTRVVQLPVVPEKVRERKEINRHERPEPRYNDDKKRPQQPPYVSVQRQPKSPPPVQMPKLPQKTSDQRGSQPPKSFGPPRFR